MDYSKLSDFEINKAVAEKSGFEVKKHFSTNQNAVGGFLYYQQKGNIGRYLIDYCNSWADMGKIIEREKIDLRYEGGFGYVWEASHMKHINQYDCDLVGLNEHKNPLRAAAIVYLMMEDAK